ncbi:MAG TPA: bifunctional UDP-N-acetylglucosamine diphosphorylase/glucosamine-1-phosphate N-acetyltransferase GlmU [Polyangiaceae bacterium]|jgi:bifunctional UDP-N-acetylglucosamine pyrophosphorylase/glucosamine-1-phosphate N-acetyltransferase
MSEFDCVVLAAGDSKRMKSRVPKVLHRVAGRPLMYYPVRAALELGAKTVVVVNNPQSRDAVQRELGVCFVESVLTAVQQSPLGTGDATRVGLEAVNASRVLVLYADTPLLKVEDLARLTSELDRGAKLAFMSCILGDPSGYGRVLRDERGWVRAVREDRDLENGAERAVSEVNAGCYAVDTQALRGALSEIKPHNAQGEYYLTDGVELIAAQHPDGARALLGDPAGLFGVNDRAELRQAERLLFERIALRHARRGVTVHIGARIDDTVQIDPDAEIESGVCLRGHTQVASSAWIDVGCVVTDSRIAEGAILLPYCVVSGSSIGPEARVGPFAHIRPESEIDREAHVGNFVETKKTRLRRGAKANHLAYLGDGDVGEGANIGAGTIFCNYDGFQKHSTVIGKGAFIGSDTQLVAPVAVGDGAYVATGTTVTHDVPKDALAIGRARQQNKAGYATKLRAKLEAGSKK